MLLDVLNLLCGCSYLFVDHVVDLLEIFDFLLDLIKPLVLVGFQPLRIDLLLALQLWEGVAQPVGTSTLDGRELINLLLQVLSALDVVFQPSRLPLFLLLQFLQLRLKLFVFIKRLLHHDGRSIDALNFSALAILSDAVLQSFVLCCQLLHLFL